MTKDEVIACLGPPLDFNPDFLSYSALPPIFDLSFDRGQLSFMNVAGSGFCFAHDICLDRRGNVRELAEYYGDEVYVTEDEAGFRILTMEGELDGRPVQTTLLLNGVGGSINQIEIGWQDR